MPRAEAPATPTDELAGYAKRSGAGPHDRLLTEELAAFWESGLSVVLAACGLDERPVAGVGLACRVLGEDRIRILLRRTGSESLLASLERGGVLAATFSRPTDHRSIQMKGPAIGIEEAGVIDVQQTLRQCEGLRDQLMEVGYSRAFAAGYVAHTASDLVAVDCRVSELYVQTPGAGAGSALR